MANGEWRIESETILYSLLAIRYSPSPSRHQHLCSALGQFLAERTLIKLCDAGAFEFVALVQEGEAEGEADVVEYLGILRPGDDGTWAHDGREVTVDERVARHVGDADHRRDLLLLL